MADNFKTISDLDIWFKEFMPGQVIQSTQFNDDMKDIEEKVNEVIGQHNGVANTVVDHLNNKNNPAKNNKVNNIKNNNFFLILLPLLIHNHSYHFYHIQMLFHN